MAELNTPLIVGDFEIKNRLVMAPITRARSGESRVPNDFNGAILSATCKCWSHSH